MSDRLLPALVAVFAGAVLAVLLFVPYVARQYRRRGELGPGRAVLALGLLVYGLAVIAYVLLPLPQITPDFCSGRGSSLQLHPLTFLADIQKEQVGSGVAALLRNPAFQQVAFNVALFVPLGMFVRHLFRRGVAVTTLIGFSASLLIEVTQVTGVWFLYPCPYRLFDVDDLLANTAGAVLGALLAPVLRLVPGQRVEAPAEEPRPVTTARRLLGMLCDLLAVVLTGSTLMVVVNIALWGSGESDLDGPSVVLLATVSYWLPALAQLGLVLAGDATLGERVVRVRATTRSGGRPGVVRRVVRWAFGIGGFSVLAGLTTMGWSVAALLAFLLGCASVLAAWRSRGHRGLACATAGLEVADARAVGATTAGATAAGITTEPRPTPGPAARV
ncbi:RDD family protein [Streptoalloteichus tenebrarius]|uniref:RDD family protein n=1 Tax=Streptoalloteichus tenebrarius (strain ATCC 17920 / DSM 40477 / JCM 4838 / CBS 697.72 / NBRC 16177 / NCIMB 11028 / NRRL B-12390 / A12253. 1 / ISP 5477) TaxID=1933 RepID=A0ABT1HZ18_STRSD|nr:VanZ family protein [Streptoalloteichus tenebrarius]MCP2260764.1 RDD family protein [Streptoalloteichus tenebrarius]